MRRVLWVVFELLIRGFIAASAVRLVKFSAILGQGGSS